MNYQELLAVADKLPKYKTKDEDFDENDECCICLKKDNLWKTSCNHIICKKCIPQMKYKLCPLCRKNLLKEIYKINETEARIFMQSPYTFFFIFRTHKLFFC